MVKDASNTAAKAVSKTRSKTVIEPEAEGDIYRKAVDIEEKEALQRTATADAFLYFETCGIIRSLFDQILTLKQTPTDENKAKISTKCQEACVLIALLKKMNRFEKVRLISSREKLNQEKTKADSINLQYQNLLYELAHLVSEFRKCELYKSKDKDIELITVNQFLKEGPEAVLKKYSGKDLDEINVKHDLHLAMLEYELSQRSQLSILCGTLDTKKKQLAKDIVQRKERLGGLGPRLAAVLEATKPLQEQLGLPIDKIRKEHKLASLLPDSLYLLYCYGDAYKQVHDIGMSIDIVGDQEEAVQYNEILNTLNDAESDIEAEPQEEPTSKKRRHRKTSAVDKLEEKKKKLVEPHPLSIQISMVIKEGPTLKFKLYYRSHLKIVTVMSSMEIPTNITGNSAREVLQGDSILNELFKADFGVRSPNGANDYQLKKVGLTSFETLVSKIGYAYIWAQKICGHDFLNSKDKSNKVGHSNIDMVFKAIYKRLESRFALAQQLQQLEFNCIISIPEDIDYPKNAVATLTKWTSISFQKFFTDTPNAMSLVDLNIAESTDMFYTVTIARPKATLHASVIIKNDYPMAAPVFVIYIKYNGDLNAGNSDNIRDMERAVNITWEQSLTSAGWLLSAQLRYLCSCFDVYLESSEAPGFSQSTNIIKNVCARNRRHPYKYRKWGKGAFTQY